MISNNQITQSNFEISHMKKSLFIALHKEMRNQCIDKISVSKLLKSATVSRSTFYRYFYDKYQLLNTYYDSILNQTLYRYEKDLSWTEALSSIYIEIKNNLEFYQNALQSNEMNCLREHIMKISNDFHFSILEKNNVNLNNWKNKKLIQSYIFGNFDLMCLWINEGMKEPISEMVPLMTSRLPEQFIQFFN